MNSFNLVIFFVVVGEVGGKSNFIKNEKFVKGIVFFLKLKIVLNGF